ncbi:MAG: hypothetical protein WB611_10120, partial [Stellaceae bacterium]
FSILSRSMAVSKLDLRKNQMAAAGDKARSQMQDLPEAQNRLMNGEFEMGSHHFSLGVYADNLADLDDNIGLARARLAEAGAIAVPETLGIEAAYWAQLPGNLDWRTRPAVVSSLNFRTSRTSRHFRSARQAGAGAGPLCVSRQRPARRTTMSRTSTMSA